MLSFILKLRLKQIFLDSSNGLALGLRYIMMILAVVYGSLYGYLLNKLEEKTPVTVEIVTKIEFGILVFIIISFVIKNYIPQYKGSTKFINNVYPVSASKRALGHLINDLASSLFVGFGIFYSLFVGMADKVYINSAPSLIMATLSWIIVERNFRRWMDFNLKLNTFHLLIIFGFIGGLSQLAYTHFQGFAFSNPLSFVLYAGCLSLIFFHTLFIDASIIDSKESSQEEESINESNTILPILFRLTWKKNKTRVALLIGFSTKLILGIIGFLLGGKGELMMVYQFLIFSPMLFSSQIFANFFGFFREFWLAYQTYSIKKSDFEILFAKYFGLIILCDFVLSGILMLSIYHLSFYMIIYYLISIPIAYLVCIYASFKYPFFVEKVIATHNSSNTSPIVGFLVILIVTVLGLLTHYELILWASPLIFILCYKIYLSWPKKRNKLAPLVYDRLFKG